MRPGRFLAALLLGCAGVLATAGAGADEDTLATLLRQRCGAPGADEETLNHADFRSWQHTREGMAEHFRGIYHGGKRLPERARWNEARRRLELILERRGQRHVVPISLSFVANVTAHVEQGLALGYFEHLYFADLGHAHLLVWRPFHEREIRALAATELPLAYARILAHPRTRFLYHAAEQLRMTDAEHRLLPDRYLGWRFFTRNLVGENHPGNLLIYEALDTPGNAVHEGDEDYRWWGAGFSLSASRDGCFPFRDGDETLFFDISLAELPSPIELLAPLVLLRPAETDRP